MIERKRFVTMKGHRTGLAVHVNERCSVEEFLDDLELTLEEKSVENGRAVPITFFFGRRYVDEGVLTALESIVARHDSFLYNGYESDCITKEEAKALYGDRTFHYFGGTARSGQVLDVEGSIVVVGDINPGAVVRATGSIYCLGALRGTVHAGKSGYQDAVIAASILQPKWLSICDIVYHEIEEEPAEALDMGCAFLGESGLEFSRLQTVPQARMDQFAIDSERG
ncbi:septum site-determining protein MinC [Exiguobacterium flavidum]|uniref:septum site-determining protein MinC n=1 Tax=Exiguobacterium flavidum TaxID=2184695 RepID=UPI000DF79BF9|nr:septum site-determining protein MinC [Exiguobacterium flavidum]